MCVWNQRSSRRTYQHTNAHIHMHTHTTHTHTHAFLFLLIKIHLSTKDKQYHHVMQDEALFLVDVSFLDMSGVFLFLSTRLLSSRGLLGLQAFSVAQMPSPCMPGGCGLLSRSRLTSMFRGLTWGRAMFAQSFFDEELFEIRPKYLASLWSLTVWRLGCTHNNTQKCLSSPNETTRYSKRNHKHTKVYACGWQNLAIFSTCNIKCMLRQCFLSDFAKFELYSSASR